MSNYRPHTAKIQERRKARSSFRMAFLGDSVTQGCFETVENNGRFDTVKDYGSVYHNRLKEMAEAAFPECPVSVINAGIGGDNIEAVMPRLKTDVIDACPDITVICLGLNDVHKGMDGLESFKHNLGAILQKLHAADIKTVFLTPNMMCTEVRSDFAEGGMLHTAATGCRAAQLNGTMDAYMKGAAEVCAQNATAVCDCYCEWKKLYASGTDINLLLCNGINHPTREMHAMFAEKLFETIFA